MAKEEELGKNKVLLGLTDVTGEGIVIEMEDAGKEDSALFVESASAIIHYEDLLSIVNELRNAGAEAIEINGQRVVNTSSITCEGTVIKINGEKIGSPFTIKAIGSQALLYVQMDRIGSYLEAIASEGIKIKDIRKENNITISRYNGTITFKYIKLLRKK